MNLKVCGLESFSLFFHDIRILTHLVGSNELFSFVDLCSFLIELPRMDPRETSRLTLAIMAKLAGETEDEIYNFFKTSLKGECSYREAKQAIEDSCRLIEQLPNRPLTTAKVFSIAAEFLAERERLRLEEEEKARAWDWDQPSTRPSSSSSRDLLGVDEDDESVSEAQRQKAENARRTFVEDIKWLMSSPRGRRIVWWLLEKAGVNRTSFNNSGSVMAFNEGQRNMGLMLQAQVVELSPEAYMTMLTEQRTK